MSVDREGFVSVWDFIRQERLLYKSLHEIINQSGKTNQKIIASSGKVTKNRTFVQSRLINSNNHVIDENKIPTNHSSSPIVSKYKEYGTIKCIQFIDRIAIQTYNKIQIPIIENTFHTSGKILIICDQIIIFYDFITNITNVLTNNELSKHPTIAEFISPNLCAIGCSDGIIRYI